MKKATFLSISLLLAIINQAQVTPEAFLAQFPAPPSNACEMKSAQRQEYLDKVQSVTEEIREVMDNLNEEMEAREPEMEKQALNKVAQQYGLSAADLQKLQGGGKMSEEEQKALADKMLQNSMNISLGEVDNLKKMGKEGREAWAQAYSTEIMADAQADPDKYKNQQLQAKDLFELTTKQKHLLDSLKAIETKFGKQFNELENNNEAIAMRKEIDRLEKERMSMIGIGNEDKMAAISNQIRSLKRSYCNKYTPANTALIQDYLNHTRSSLPAYYRLEEIQSALTKAQTGIDMKMKKGHMALGKVESAGGILLKVFNYNLFTGFDEE